jgi:hypothetical protein
MKRLSVLVPIVFSSQALAHPGHLATTAGHSHWLALAAFGGAAVVAIVAIVRSQVRRRRLAHD